MIRITYILPALLAVLAGLLHADEDGKSRNRAERRLLNMEKRAAKIAKPGNTAANMDEASVFLLRETQRLIERSRSLVRPSYAFDRTLEAIDDLLDAREDLHAAAH